MNEPILEPLLLTGVTSKKRAFLWRLLQLYLYDFSEIDQRDINAIGEFEYREFGKYCFDPAFKAFFATYNKTIVGFCMVHLRSETHYYLKEFFILRKFRLRGLGTALAFNLFDQHHGTWVLTILHQNTGGRKFWNETLKSYYTARGIRSARSEYRRKSIQHSFRN